MYVFIKICVLSEWNNNKPNNSKNITQCNLIRCFIAVKISLSENGGNREKQ